MAIRAQAGTKHVGSLLGMFDHDGLLHHVGFASNIAADARVGLTRQVEKLVEPPGFTGRGPGGPSRWSTERSGQWQPLRAALVVEVQYDEWSGERFRHGTRLLRRRPEKAPRQCTLKQVEQESAQGLALLAEGARNAGSHPALEACDKDRIMSIRRVYCYAAFAPLLLIASGAESAIYRCAQPSGVVLYSDFPCDGASVVDIHPGSADPNARERLARVQAELDRAAADRRAREQFEDARSEALRRGAPAEQSAPGPSGGAPELYGTAYDFYAPYAFADPRRSDRHRGASSKFRDREKRVPQVVRTPHAPR